MGFVVEFDAALFDEAAGFALGSGEVGGDDEVGEGGEG